MALKHCAKCRTAKALDEFQADRRKRDGKRSQCRACREASRRSQRRASRDSTNRSTPEARARHREQQRAYYEAHRGEILKRKRAYYASRAPRYKPDPERARAADARKRKAHPERGRQRAKNHRARKRGAEGATTAAQALGRAEMFGLKCWICSGPYQAMDHVKPLAAGGANWPANLRPVCRDCNSTKKDKWLGVAALADLAGQVRSRLDSEPAPTRRE